MLNKNNWYAPDFQKYQNSHPPRTYPPATANKYYKYFYNFQTRPLTYLKKGF